MVSLVIADENSLKPNNETDIKICDISDDESHHDVTGLNRSAQPERSLLDESTINTSALSDLTSSTHDESARSSSTQRPNKLLRTRAPVNQNKTKDADLLLMETSLMILDSSPQRRPHDHDLAVPSTSNTLSIGHSADMPSTSGLQAQSFGLISQPSTSQSILHEYSTTLINVLPASTASANGNVTTTELELVLSPAKLGQ